MQLRVFSHSKGSGAGRSSQIRTAQGWEPGSQEGLPFPRESLGAAKSARHKDWGPASQEDVPKQGSQEEVSKQGSQWFPRGSQEQVPKQGFPSKVPRNRFERFPARFPGKVTRNRFPSKGSQQEVPKQGSQEEVTKKKVFRKRFPGKAPKRFQARFPGSQARVPRKRFPSKVKFLGTACKYGSQKGFPSKVPGIVSKQGSKQNKVPRTGFQASVSRKRFPGRGVQARYPASWSPSNVFRKRFTSKVPKHVPKQGSQEEVPKQGSQEQVPRNKLPNKFPKNRFTSKAPGKSSQAMFPGKGSQARFPGTASQARLLGRGSQARFPGRGSQARVPSCSWKFCFGTSSSWERLLENLFLRALVLLGTLLGNGSWDLDWEPFLGTVLASDS